MYIIKFNPPANGQINKKNEKGNNIYLLFR